MLLQPANTLDAIAHQKRLFALIAAQNPNQAVAGLISEALHLNKSAVYKRLSGEKLLLLDEYLQLLNRFNIHPTQLNPSDGSANFRFDVLEKEVQSCAEFLQLVLGNFQAFGRFPDLKIWFATDDLPLFYHALFRELALFKMFSYARLNWQLPYTEHLVFHPDSFPEKDIFEKYLQPIWKHYAAVPTVEFWTDEIYDNTAKHIRYFSDSGQIADTNVVSLLFEQLEALMNLQQKMVASGYKFSKASEPLGSLELYYNEFSPSNMTTILGESAFFQGVFAIFDDPNFMFISDPAFYNYTLHHLKKLSEKSVKLSGEAEFARRRFFSLLQERVRR